MFFRGQVCKNSDLIHPVTGEPHSSCKIPSVRKEFCLIPLQGAKFTGHLLTLWSSAVLLAVTILSSGGGNDKPLQDSCLDKPINRGAWWATVHGVTESDTTEWLSTHSTLFATLQCRTRLRTLALTFAPGQSFYREKGINRCMIWWAPMLLKSIMQVNTNLITLPRSCLLLPHHKKKSEPSSNEHYQECLQKVNTVYHSLKDLTYMWML